jgi:arylsulfatase A-like enzyme
VIREAAPAGRLRRGIPTLGLLGCVLAAAAVADARTVHRFPDVLILSIDTLRADRLSSAGYERPTSPHIDRLLARGVNFERARTIEPLTNPALTSLLTSVPPHVHGSTRNGIPARSGLASLPRLLDRRGYRTGAFLGNWTLKEKISGLADHWRRYEVIVSRKRWLGFYKDEARASDVTSAALDWVEELRDDQPGRPYLLWVHYVEPHAPYRLHREYTDRLGIARRSATPSDRYDTEIAAVDAEVGRLLEGLDRHSAGRDRFTVLLGDHGEAFGEHGEVGHGRVLHEATLRVPLGFVWPGRIEPGVSSLPASLLDVAPTALALLGLPPHPYFRGVDLTPALAGEPLDLPPLCLQSHKGAVQSAKRAQRARRAGLIEVGHLKNERLEVMHLGRNRVRLHDLENDPHERLDLGSSRTVPSAELAACLAEIRAGLAEHDRFVPPDLDPETAERLRSLGYLD